MRIVAALLTVGTAGTSPVPAVLELAREGPIYDRLGRPCGIPLVLELLESARVQVLSEKRNMGPRGLSLRALNIINGGIPRASRPPRRPASRRPHAVSGHVGCDIPQTFIDHVKVHAWHDTKEAVNVKTRGRQ